MRQHHHLSLPLSVMLIAGSALASSLAEVRALRVAAHVGEAGVSAKNESGHRAAREARLKSARKNHLRASELVLKGIDFSEKPATARRYFRSALAYDGRALKALESLRRDSEDDGEVIQTFWPLMEAVRTQARRTHLHLVQLDHDQATYFLKQGLSTTRRMTTSRKHFRRALAFESRAQEAIDDLRKSIPRGDDFIGTISPIARGVKEQTIGIHLHIAHLYTARQSYNNAREWVNKALAIEPTNREVLATRARIELAISSSSRIG